MNKTKKILLSIFLGIIGFALLTGIIFFAIEPGIPTDRLNEDGVANRYLSLPNGFYLGDSVAGILSGEGTFEFDTGEIYDGSWSMHNMNGKGKLSCTAGNYDGEFKDSQRSGNGTFVWTDGTEYVGAWASDKMNGKGVLTTSDNIVYTGTFVNNIFSEGTIDIENETAKYALKVSEGEMSDIISVVYANGTTYEGEFSGAEISGEGVMTFPNKGKYEGNFVDGKRDGSGVFTWSDGSSYDGKWNDDLMDGSGKYTFKDGSYLQGTFEEGKLDGKYTYYVSGVSYKTTWVNGKCTAITKS